MHALLLLPDALRLLRRGSVTDIRYSYYYTNVAVHLVGIVIYNPKARCCCWQLITGMSNVDELKEMICKAKKGILDEVLLILVVVVILPFDPGPINEEIPKV